MSLVCRIHRRPELVVFVADSKLGKISLNRGRAGWCPRGISKYFPGESLGSEIKRQDADEARVNLVEATPSSLGRTTYDRSSLLRTRDRNWALLG